MKATTFRQHLVYWILPSIVTLACIFIFYLDLFGLSQFISPEINREFGLVENIQLIILLLIFFRAIKGIKTEKVKIVQYGFVLIAIFTVFVFLEEIDYGLHYYDYFNGKGMEETRVVLLDQKVRNIHNQGKVTLNLFKMAAYILIALFFVIYPLLPKKQNGKYFLFNYLQPSYYIITTAASLLITNRVALYLYRNYNYENKSLNSNVSEFEEMMIYYIIFLYIAEIVKKSNNAALSHVK